MKILLPLVIIITRAFYYSCPSPENHVGRCFSLAQQRPCKCSTPGSVFVAGGTVDASPRHPTKRLPEDWRDFPIIRQLFQNIVYESRLEENNTEWQEPTLRA